MAAYPGPKVHRSNRRKLGRGQFPSGNSVAVVVTDAGSVATLTFSKAVVVSGIIPMTVSGGRTFVSQTVVSPTVVTQTWSGALTTLTYVVPANTPNVGTSTGGVCSGAAGTFS
jgi:hypothetical protein